MKDFLPTTYTFTPGTSGVGTVTLDIPNFDPKRLVAIINQTRGIVIYSTGSVDLRYSSISANTLTLFFDTSAQNANDILQVVYNSDAPLEIDYQPTLRQMLYAVMYPNWLDRTINAIRVAVINTIATVTTVTTVTTLTTLTNQTNIGSYTADVQNYAGSRTAWSQIVRGRIS
jgi:hypothetical protein